MQSTRLRKAFRYPDDEDDDEPVDGIDEEEQDKLIAEISLEDIAKTEFFQKAFVSIPALSLILYLRPLFSPSSFSEFLTACLAITSLCASAYILYFVPLRSPGRSPTAARDPQTFDVVNAHLESGSPIERSIGYLNGALCAVVALSSWAAGTRVSPWEGYLPGLILGLVYLVRSQLAPVDVAGLERLRYGYKGA
ncbi:uncharacterized protein K452DRAFT_297705 [Aplosporella prunicola CBS 121167]|uniref:Uncharacterized protein n=1 Tax=Aplosporella prunicola CBS 121167 TaxID=1176127 RepID=A0A6A6BG80_9PEZI|nr:uncharacterized protein K452DRAFT_297705 [Aplosporella prunicola CBS 121167]KAF2142413.1 hypothetical protein K452DRAFT_297705 [Aplosporella prunicola CBS 121167]